MERGKCQLKTKLGHLLIKNELGHLSIKKNEWGKMQSLKPSK
jgi:hypothetical protein